MYILTLEEAAKLIGTSMEVIKIIKVESPLLQMDIFSVLQRRHDYTIVNVGTYLYLIVCRYNNIEYTFVYCTPPGEEVIIKHFDTLIIKEIQARFIFIQGLNKGTDSTPTGFFNRVYGITRIGVSICNGCECIINITEAELTTYLL